MSTTKAKPPELVTVADIATWTAFDKQTIRKKTRRGDIPGAINLGTERRPIWRYDAREVTAWITASRQQSA